MTTRRIVHALIFASVIALPLAQGCGGDDAAVNTNPGSDAGDDGDSATTTGNDSGTPTDSSTPPPDSATTDTFCAAVSAYYTRCSLTDACDTARAAACAANEAIASPGAIAAYEACSTEEPCSATTPVSGDDGGTKAYEDCLAAHYGTPSMTLTTVVTDYCSRCASGNPAQCDEGPVAHSLAQYDDAVLTQIQTTCLTADAGVDDGGPAGKCGNFDKCTRDIIVAHDPPPAACNDE